MKAIPVEVPCGSAWQEMRSVGKQAPDAPDGPARFHCLPHPSDADTIHEASPWSSRPSSA